MDHREGSRLTPKEYDWSIWEGVDLPRYTNIPDDFVDLLMPHLSEAEFKVLMYIARHTYGYKKSEDNISINQMVNGIRRGSGRMADLGTGMSASSIKKAIKSLEQKGIIAIERRQAPPGDAAVNLYRIRHKMVGGAESDQPLARIYPTVGQNSATQETIEQDNNIQDDNESLSLALKIGERCGRNSKDRKALVTSLSKYSYAVLQRVQAEIDKRLAEGEVQNPGAYANRLAQLFFDAERETTALEAEERQQLFRTILSTAAFESSNGRSPDRLREVLLAQWPSETELIERSIGLVTNP